MDQVFAPGEPKISVLVPHYNQLEALRLCLNSLAEQDCSEPYEIIVADNNTPGGVACLVRDYPEILFVSEKGRGAALARNAAMAAARGEVFAFTDSDCVPASNWLREGVLALEAGRGELVGGDVLVTCDNPAEPTAVESFEKVFGFRQWMYIAKKGFSVTANIFVRADVARKIGPFTNGLSEDVDWCHRAKAAGFRLCFSDRAVVAHPARADWRALCLKWNRLIEENWQGERAHGRHWLAWVIRAVVVALSALPHGLVVVFSQRLKTGKEKKAALGVLFKIRFWRCGQMFLKIKNLSSFENKQRKAV